MTNAIRIHSAIILVLIGCGGSPRGAAPPPSGTEAWTFPWHTTGVTLHCRAVPTDVGGVRLHALEIHPPGGPALREPVGGELLNVFFELVDEDRDESLLVTQWTGGANTFFVRTYRFSGGSVRRVLDVVTATQELGMMDIDGNGATDLLMIEPRENRVRIPRAYLWRGDRFVPTDVSPASVP